MGVGISSLNDGMSLHSTSVGISSKQSPDKDSILNLLALRPDVFVKPAHVDKEYGSLGVCMFIMSNNLDLARQVLL